MYPKGLTISEISQKLKLNRNSAAKYLEILLVSGQVETQSYGTARVFYLTHRVPISAMLSASADLVFTVDENNKVVFANDHFMNFFAIGKDDVIGHHIVDICRMGSIDADLADLFADMLAHVVSDRETIVRKGDGVFFYRVKSIETVFDDGCKGTTIVLEDISHEVEYRTKLEANEARYREVVESQSELIIRWMPDRTIVFCNEAFCRFFGLKQEDTIGKKFMPAIPEDEREAVAAHFSSLTRENPSATCTHRVILPDGTARWIRWNDLAIFTPDNGLLEYQSVGTDITGHQRLRDEEKRHLRDVELLSRTLREFIEMAPESDIYGKIAADLGEMLPAAAGISVCSVDAARKTATLRAAGGRPTDRESSGIIVRDPVGTAIILDEMTIAPFRTGTIITAPPPSIFGAAYPPDTSPAAPAGPDPGAVLGIGFTRKGTCHGYATFLVPGRLDAHDTALLEAYAAQVSIALQKKMAENALVANEKKFRSIVEFSPFPISVIEPDGRYVYVNDKFTKTFGYTIDDIPTGRDWFRLAFPDQVLRNEAMAAWVEYIRNAAQGENPSRVFSVMCKDRSTRKIMFQPVIIRGEDHFIVYKDLTKEWEASQERGQLAAIIESSNDAIIGKRADGTILSWNPAAEKLYGYTAEEMIGRSVSVIVPDDRKGEIDLIQKRVENGDYIANFETRRVRKDGTVIDVVMSASPIKDCKGTVVGVATIVRDITASKAEERLKDSEEKYRALLESLHIGVYRSTGDPKGRWLWGNPDLARILGYASFDDLREVPVSDVFLSHEGRKVLLADLQKNGVVRDREIHLRKKDGSPLAVSVTALAKSDDDGKIRCITGIVLDITGQKQVEKSLAEARGQIQHIAEFLPDPIAVVDYEGSIVAWNRAMETMIGVKAHEIVGRKDWEKVLSPYVGDRPFLLKLFMDPDADGRYPGITKHREGLVGRLKIRPPGSSGEVTVIEKVSPLYDAEGRRIGAFETVHPVSE